MTHISNSDGARAYRSELRTQQADETRVRILDATVRVMARGVASVSIPDVAREAGVSVPTVYRHFGTKAELLAAVYPHLTRRTSLDQMTLPRSVDEFRDFVRSIFERLDSFDDLARAAAASPAGEEARHVTMPDRFAMSQRFVAAIQPDLPESERDRIARLLVVLTASASLRMWRDHLGASADQAAADIDWLLRSIIAAKNTTKARAGR
jgi:AcrR family transcriptional regulator